jgi:hypothetical protein
VANFYEKALFVKADVAAYRWFVDIGEEAQERLGTD